MKLYFGAQIQIIVRKQFMNQLSNILMSSYGDIILLDQNTMSPFFQEKTIQIYDNKQLYQSVQLKTKALQYNDHNITALYCLLFFLKYEDNIDYNSSCGFHIHTSIYNYSVIDHTILLYQFLNNKKYKQVLYIK